MGDPAIAMAAMKTDSAQDGHPPSPVRAFQWDLARQVERIDWLGAQLPRLADWGYQELYLHLEDAVEYPSLPGVARKDAYSRRELGSLVRAATRAGLGVVPIVNLLGHTQYLIKVPGLRDLNECRAPDGSPLPQGQVCPLHPAWPKSRENSWGMSRSFARLARCMSAWMSPTTWGGIRSAAPKLRISAWPPTSRDMSNGCTRR